METFERASLYACNAKGAGVLKLLLPLVLLVLALGATIVSDRPLPPAELTIINRAEVTTLDVSQITWMQDIRVAKCLYEGLVRNDVLSPDFAIKPAAAERWEVSSDGLRYTFHLRETRWSDGSVVLASDFLYSWMRSLLPDSATDYSGFLMHIRGGRDYFQWRERALADFARSLRERGLSEDSAAAEALWTETKRRFTEMVGVRSPNQRTIEIELERPLPYFLEMLGFITFSPVREQVVRRYEIVDAASGRVKWDQSWTKPPRLVTNGPMMVDQWRFRREMRLVRNPHYWDPAAIGVESISIPVIDDQVSQVLAFETGSVDWVSDVTAPFRGEIVERKRQFHREHADEVNRLRAMGLGPVEIDRRLPADPRRNVQVLPSFGTYFWNLNCAPRLPDGRANPMADPRVRRALAMAVDKEAIATGVRRVGEAIAPTLIPPGSIAGYRSPKGLGFDPEAARRLLAEAGYPGGEGFMTLDLLVNKDGGHELIAQAIAKDWKRHLNIETTISVQEIKVFRDRLRTKNFVTSRGSWFGDYGDPTTFLDLNRSGDGNNDRAFASPRFDAVLDRAAEETDPARRMELLTEAERLIVEEELPLIPIFHYVNIYLFDPSRLDGVSTHPRSEQHLYRMRRLTPTP